MLIWTFFTCLAVIPLLVDGDSEDLVAISKELPAQSISSEEALQYDELQTNPNAELNEEQLQPGIDGRLFPKKDNRIIGGSFATLRQFPWSVYIKTDGKWLCSGSLISSTTILTAAHCVYEFSEFSITAGGIERSTTEPTEQTRTTTFSIVHPDYNSTFLYNDIALLFVDAPFFLGEFVRIVRLPRTSDSASTLAGRWAVVAGYGLTENGLNSQKLKFVSLQTITNSACASRYFSNIVLSSTLCTAPYKIKSFCKGDDGAGLVYKEADGQFTVIGVASFVGQYSCTNVPLGFARVSSFLEFISSNTDIIIRS